jgi:putative lipoprotein
MIRRVTVLAGCFATLTLAACVTTPTAPAPSPGATEESSAPPTEARAARVTGSVFYLERIALTPEAVVQVEVVEVAQEGGSESVLGERTLSSPGQVPIHFSVDVPAERIRPESRYVVRARITDAGRVFTTPEPVPVLTQGHPSQDVRVRVRVSG